MNTTNTIDCRGQRCPAPILTTAKAARTMGTAGGGVLEIAADDDAFPLDIRSWCRSSGAQLVDLHSDGDGVHRAVVRVVARSGGSTVQGVAPSTPPRARPPMPPKPPAPVVRIATAASDVVTELTELDFRGKRCPEPILGLARRARALGPGAELEVVADDPAFRLDLESWCRSAGATLVSMEPQGDALRARIRLARADREGASTTKLGAAEPAPAPVAAEPVVAAPVQASVVSLQGVPAQMRLTQLEAAVKERAGQRVRILADDPGFGLELMQWAAAAGHRVLSLESSQALRAELELAAAVPVTALAPVEPTDVALAQEDRCTLLVLHNDREALLAALLVAVGAAAQGMNVMMFFTFWGLNLLRGEGPNPAIPAERVSWSQRMFKWMMPRGPKRQKLGKLNMGGIGGSMLGSIMKRYELMDIPQLMAAAEEQGVSFVACTMSMQVMGITKRDLSARSNLEYGGVAAFVESAARSKMSLTF
ncbi:MAG: sulfurtransferase TusA family protein [Nannocystaceae bacterium]